MRRLFFSFPRGAPGVGLLLLRVVSGTNLLFTAIVALTTASGLGAALDHVLSAVLGLILLAGLWTPIAGVLAAIHALWHGFAYPADESQSLSLATIGAALALLGPGAWSIDARLFGWRRIDIPGKIPPDSPPF